jgi:2-polyprenyl-3-methyl-5-hydroxy-6-metoxy-1,4-benzoquinol methylase
MTWAAAETNADRAAALCCMVCGRADLKPSFFLPEYTVHRCPGCGHGTTEYTRKIADNQSRFGAARWTETRSMMQSHFQAAARRRYEDLLAFSPGHAVLEVGCGTGEFLSIAREAGHSVIGLDMSAEAVRYVQDRHPGMDIRCQLLETAGLPPASFDVVAGFHILEHVSDPIGLLQQMSCLVRPGGLVYVRVPNLDTWFRRVLGRSWWAFGVEHMGHFTAVSLRTAVAEAGLDVAAVRSGDSYPHASYWPVLPLLFSRCSAMRAVGNALQPRPDTLSDGGSAEAVRMAVKRTLVAAYCGYVRVGSALIRPLTDLQLRRGGGPELMAVGRAPRRQGHGQRVGVLTEASHEH